MSPAFALFLLFTLLPLAEIYVLIRVGGWIGAGWTVLGVVGTAVLGVALLRAQGLATLARAHRALERGELPALELLEGAVLVVAGALLLTPGFITDTLGFLCLVPPLRRELLRRFLASRTLPPQGPVVIEGEFRREDDPDGS
ncbi:FxsA family protein [Inmirania thermothiophila]|uniref:UPF0716 protein FxsA n=1 Tax=Inmirania thermothiophila TaxID=1750597 RepID=A0A3N1XSI1_9GAMM|nr:FxsA family protein [Inmirania thermothiophila]ROR29599.1 UPF0716 protein FxsA [Inmirania thermothiophila]